VVFVSSTLKLYRPGGVALTMYPGDQELINDIGDDYAAVSIDAVTQRIWVNGQLESTQSGSATSETSTGIGFMNNRSGNRPIRSNVSELVLVSGTPTNAEIAIINKGVQAYSAWNSSESAAAQ